MNNSRVSIAVIATSCEHLTSTLDSLIEQTYNDVAITVLHSITDTNMHGIIRNYKKIIYSIDIEDKDAIKKVRSFGRYFCIINSGDIVSSNWVENAVENLTKKRISVLATLPVKLNDEGNIIRKPMSLINNYEILANAFLKRAVFDAVLLIDTKHFGDYSSSSIRFSCIPMVGIRNKVPDNNTRIMQSYIDHVINNNSETILSNTPEDKRADVVALLIYKSLRKGSLHSAFMLFISAMHSSGYRKAIIKSFLNKDLR
jgi:hypothetical protein